MSTSANWGINQLNPFLSLPTEILLQIVEDESFEWRDHLSLRHASCRLWDMTGKLVFAGRDFFLFRKACMLADVSTLAESAKYEAVPTNTAWLKGYYQDWEKIDPNETYYKKLNGRILTPGSVVCLGTRFSAKGFLETWKWLSDNGYQLHEYEFEWDYPETRSKPTPKQYHCFPEQLLQELLWPNGDRQSICDTIRFLVEKGLRFPLQFYRWDFRPRIMSDFEGNRTSSMAVTNVMDTLMHPNCPPDIMELYLKQISALGLTLKSHVKDQVDMADPERPREVTDIQNILCCLFEYCLPSWIGKIQDPRRYIGDCLESKIELLIKYQGIDNGEKRVLKDILGALRRIEDKCVRQGGLSFDQDGVWCWYELCTSISYIVNEPVLSISPLGRSDYDIIFFRQYREGDLHGFYHNDFFYLPDWLAIQRGQRAGERGQDLDLPHFEDRTKIDWYNMPMHDWDYILTATRGPFPCSKGHRAMDAAGNARLEAEKLKQQMAAQAT
ncbi:hypothetical protein IL306_008612 [Fusarium sp. DS 682]|nr:hypothetical protein IL306_008612 [Fusarium sp. DS 682]